MVSIDSSASWSVLFGVIGSLLQVIPFICCNAFLLYSCILPKAWVMFISLAISEFVLWSVQVGPAFFQTYSISAAGILPKAWVIFISLAISEFVLWSDKWVLLFFKHIPSLLMLFCLKLGLSLFFLQSLGLFYDLPSGSYFFSHIFQLCCCYSSYVPCCNGPIFSTV